MFTPNSSGVSVFRTRKEAKLAERERLALLNALRFIEIVSDAEAAQSVQRLGTFYEKLFAGTT